ILGIDTMIDGAHAIGSIPLDLENTGAAYYTANCHKWLCSPKSTALLHVRSDKQKGIIPLIISHAGHRAEPFAERFYWPGTADPTPALCVGDAIDYMATLVQGQWPEIMERNHQMCIRGRDVICNALKIEPPCPDNMVASMATLPLPNPSEISIPDYKGIEMLQDFFFRKYNLEVPVLFWDTPPRRFTRISAQLYNAPWQYSFYAEKLAEALKIDVRN
ncbi:MAG: aminotransferase, partial [Bacteroidota bacterium]